MIKNQTIHSGLNTLSCEILGQIAECAGVLALHELFRCGNALLSAKLGSERGVSYYSNVDEYGHLVMWSKYVLRRLKGLRHLALRSDEDQGIPSLPNSLKALGIPIDHIEILEMRSLEEYEFRGMRRRTNFWFEEDLFFPRLHTLAIQEINCYRSKLQAIMPLSMEEPEGIYVPFLSHLHLEKNLKIALPVPRCVQTLTISWREVAGMAWLNEFPNLTTLRLPNLRVWELKSKYDNSGILGPNSITHLSITSDRFRLFSNGSALSKATGFLAHFRRIVTLDTPSLILKQKDIRRLPYLTTLNCSLKRPFDFPSTIKRATIRFEEGGHGFNDVTQIPGCIVEASFCAFSTATIPLLPASLCRLHLNGLEYSLLMHLPSTLKIVKVGGTAFVRTVNAKLSIHQTGWTTRAFAANQCDFDGLETALKESVPRETIAGRWIVSECTRCTYARTLRIYQCDQVPKSKNPWILPRETLEWLRMRGLLSDPASAGSLRCSRLFELSLRDYKKTLNWAKYNLSTSDLHQTISALNSSPNQLDRVEWLLTGINIGSGKARVTNPLTSAILQDEPLKAKGLLSSGFRTLEICPLLSIGLSVSDWVETIFKDPKMEYTFEHQQVSKSVLIEILKRHSVYHYEPMNVRVALLLLDRLKIDPTKPLYDDSKPHYVSDLVLCHKQKSYLWIEAVHWMLDHNVPFQRLYYPAGYSIVHLVAPSNDLALIRKLIMKGFDMFELGGTEQITGLEMMSPPCRAVAQELLSQYKK